MFNNKTWSELLNILTMDASEIMENNSEEHFRQSILDFYNNISSQLTDKDLEECNEIIEKVKNYNILELIKEVKIIIKTIIYTELKNKEE